MTPLTKAGRFLVVALAAGTAQAVGFGEIALQSRLGENLRATIPIHLRAGETPDLACFALVRDPRQELPVPDGIGLRLQKRAGGYQLLLRGSRPLAEPAFALTVRAACDSELQRTYVLIPEPPISQPLAMAPPAPRAGGRPLLARAGETLTDIAARLAGDDPERQARQLTALRRANPDIAADEILAEGSEIQPGQRPRAGRHASPPHPAARLPAAPAPKKNNGDRLLIGAAPPPAGNGVTTAEPGLEEINGRILKMEQTLHALHDEVAKLDVALQDASAAQAERNRLQLAMQLKNPPPPVATGGRVQELLFSALLGGLLAVLVAQLIARGRERPADREMPLRMHGYRPEIRVPRAAPAEPPEITPETDERPPTATGIGVSELDLDASATELELVAVLLASGRQRGAAEALARYIENSSPNDIKPWRMLLDLYRRCGMGQEFAELRARMMRKFGHRPSSRTAATPVPAH